MSTGGFIQAKVKKDKLILSFYSGKGYNYLKIKFKKKKIQFVWEIFQ
jgi:hypothetical protein